MKRHIILFLTITLLSSGLWQTGKALWIDLKAELAQYLLNRAWSKTLTGDGVFKPWPWADTWPIGKLLAPAHGIELIVLANANGRTLAFGPGHESISALPGEKGTTILSGHRDTHFRFLEWLNKGDQLILQQPNGRTTVFAIQSMDIVDAHRTTIHLTPTKESLVLVTCYPFDAVTTGGPLRYVVTALSQMPVVEQMRISIESHGFSHL